MCAFPRSGNLARSPPRQFQQMLEAGTAFHLVLHVCLSMVPYVRPPSIQGGWIWPAISSTSKVAAIAFRMKRGIELPNHKAAEIEAIQTLSGMARKSIYLHGRPDLAIEVRSVTERL
jgi:hypothetical protein